MYEEDSDHEKTAHLPRGKPPPSDADMGHDSSNREKPTPDPSETESGFKKTCPVFEDGSPEVRRGETPECMRWVILFLSCWIMFGNYYAFDNPSALNRQLHGWLTSGVEEEHLFQYRLNLLYSVYSVPNIFLPLFVGRWLERFGNRFFLLILSVLSCLGQALFAYGVQQHSFGLAVLGRFVFGLGGESLAVSQARLVTEWFEGKELALAIGLNLSVARVGLIFNNNLSPRVAQWSNVPAALWVGFASCVISMLCTVITILIDRRHPTPISHRRNLELLFSKHRRSIHPVFWLLVLMCFLFYSSMIPYNNVASDYLQKRYYPNDQLSANMAMSIPDALAMFLVPLLGIFVDRTGKKLTTLITGAISFTVGHALLATGNSHGAIGQLIILGFGYSTMLTFWACVPDLVQPRKHGLAYGVLTSAMNLGVTVIPLAVAALINLDTSYRVCGLFFSSLGAAGLLVALSLIYINRTSRLGLDKRTLPIPVLPIADVSFGIACPPEPSSQFVPMISNSESACSSMSLASPSPCDGNLHREVQRSANVSPN